jgi:hypothetical protein
MHFQHAILIGGSDLFRIHGGAEHKMPAKCPRHPLAVIIPALPILGVRQRALSFKRQDVVLHRNVEIFLRHTGEIRHENEFLLVLQQVHPRRPHGLPDAGGLCASRERVKEPVHFVPKRL